MSPFRLKAGGAMLPVILAAMSVGAQVSLEVHLRQQSFLRDESLPVEVRIYNRSGQELHFPAGPWLTFHIERQSGASVRRKAPAPVQDEFTLESSLVGRRLIDLMPYFDLGESGRYRVTARLMIPQWGQEVVSKSEIFDITRGTTFWEQVVGVPTEGEFPEVRKYALVQVNDLKRLLLYLRLTDRVDQKVFDVRLLGLLVSFGSPEAQVDRRSNLHVLFQTGARDFLYYEITPQGQVLKRQTHAYTSTRPNLKGNDQGEIFVTGGMRRLTSEDIPPNPPTAPKPPLPQPIEPPK